MLSGSSPGLGELSQVTKKVPGKHPVELSQKCDCQKINALTGFSSQDSKFLQVLVRANLPTILPVS